MIALRRVAYCFPAVLLLAALTLAAKLIVLLSARHLGLRLSEFLFVSASTNVISTFGLLVLSMLLASLITWCGTAAALCYCTTPDQQRSWRRSIDSFRYCAAALGVLAVVLVGCLASAIVLTGGTWLGFVVGASQDHPVRGALIVSLTGAPAFLFFELCSLSAVMALSRLRETDSFTILSGMNAFIEAASFIVSRPFLVTNRVTIFSMLSLPLLCLIILSAALTTQLSGALQLIPLAIFALASAYWAIWLGLELGGLAELGVPPDPAGPIASKPVLSR